MCAAQVPGRRLEFLAHPKANFMKYQNRPSIYWLDKTTTIPVCSLTTRQKELAKHKTLNRMYKEDRPSPIWPVKSSALLAVPSPRLEKLAQAKQVSHEWMEDRPVFSIVTEATKKALPGPRIVQLAKPKSPAVPPIPRTQNTHQQNDVDGLSRTSKVVSSSRIEALAVPKMEHPEYQHDLPNLRHVPASALHVQASDRVFQLAKPKVRKSLFEGYDPYKITYAALHATASPHIVALCTPPSRRRIIRKS